MSTYLESLSRQMKNWKVAIPVLIFTIARIIYGWSWFQAGWHKLGWLSDGKLNSTGKIEGIVNGLAGPEVTRFDPLHINNLFAWVSDNIFLSMPAFTDFLVVAFEILVGVLFILGFQIFWGALVALFLNLQFLTGGSTNNFGYIVTNLVAWQWSKYFGLIGLDGFLSARKEKEVSHG